MREAGQVSVQGNLEVTLFKRLIDDFTLGFSLDFASPGIDEAQSEVGKLAAQCATEGLDASLISLARKAAAINACASLGGVYYE